MNDNWIFSDIPYTRPDVEALQARYGGPDPPGQVRRRG